MSKKQFQKSRQGQSVSDDTVATYTAAQGFLISEWLGALLMVGSFTLLYAWGLRPGANVRLAEATSAVMMVVGSAMYWRSRKVYLSLDFPWKKGWEVAATIFAASAAVFWGFFLVVTLLTSAGIALF